MPLYDPTLESLATHAVPDWFADAKLGIFIHWGLYSVPAWARERRRRGGDAGPTRLAPAGHGGRAR